MKKKKAYKLILFFDVWYMVYLDNLLALKLVWKGSCDRLKMPLNNYAENFNTIKNLKWYQLAQLWRP